MGEKPTILVAESEPSVGKVYKAMLPDYPVVTVQSMDKAIECLKNDPSIKLVFTSTMLAGNNTGYDLTEYITKNHPEVRTIFASATVEPARAREAGAADILLKPFHKPELEEMVKKHYNSGTR